MSPLLAEDGLSGAIKDVTGSATIPALVLILALVWIVKMLLAEKDARAAREREIANVAKADGEADGKLIAEATRAMAEVTTSLKSLLDHDRTADEERRANVALISSKLDEVLTTVERCGGRP